MPATAAQIAPITDFDNRPASILEQAVSSGDAEYAVDLLTRALQLTPDPNTADMLVARGFSRASHPQRFEMIADFVRAECFAEIERGARIVGVVDPIHSVGTRD